MLDAGRLCRRERNEDPDSPCSARQVELAPQPVLRDDRPRRGAGANLVFELLYRSAALGDGSVEKQIHRHDLLGFGVRPLLPKTPDVVPHFGERG